MRLFLATKSAAGQTAPEGHEDIRSILAAQSEAFATAYDGRINFATSPTGLHRHLLSPQAQPQ
jgi:hypothetical protein